MSPLVARIILGLIVAGVVFYLGFKAGQRDRHRWWMIQMKYRK